MRKNKKARCYNCLIDFSIPGIKFKKYNNQLICKECLDYLNNFTSKKTLKKELDKYFANLRRERRLTTKYDIILACSGGKDSIATLYLLVKKYKLKVLIFTIDNYFLSPRAKENLFNVAKYLRCDMFYLIGLDWRDKIVSCIKNEKMPCGPVCITNKKKAFSTIIRLINPRIKTIASGNDTPFFTRGRFSLIKKQSQYVLVRPLPAFINTQKDVFKILKVLPWQDPKIYGYTTDCLAAGYALDSFNKKSPYRFEELYICEKLRFGLISKNEAIKFINSKKRIGIKQKKQTEIIIKNFS